MTRISRILAMLVLTAAAASSASAQGSASPVPATRPERSEYRETSRYADVTAFMEAVAAASPRVHLATFGYTWEGRALPLAIVGDLRGFTPQAARASGRTIVYLQGGIHAGEVEGKEALLELLREIAQGRHPLWTDSLVLLMAPDYNADGGERIALDNRPEQHGPVAGMGTRANAQGLNINRDYGKLDTPEARAVALLMDEWDPHVLVDLHTTNGTYHAYHLTYAPPLHPNTDAAIVSMLRDRWLPEVARRARAEQGYEFFDYGNVPAPESPWAAQQGAERGWYTYDWRPRFSNHYWGLRNRFGILSETYSYLTFRERIAVQKAFVAQVLDFAARNGGEIRRLTAEADRRDLRGRELAVTARLRRTGPATVLMGEVDQERNPYSGQVMLRRRDVVRPEQMPLFIGYDAAETERVPAAWLLPDSLADVADRLRAHGVRLERVAPASTMRVEEFRVDSVRVARQESEKRRERAFFGHWVAVERAVPAGWLRVRADQPEGRLAFTLLEPRSDDGFADWGLLGAGLAAGGVYPVLREPAPPAR